MKRLFKTFLLILVIIFIAIPYHTFALNKAQRFEIERRFWYDETDTGCGTDSSASNLDFSGNNNIQIAFNFFVSQGLTTQASAALVGNFQDESGVNPRSDQAGGPGRGIAQWSEGGRWDSLVSWANSQQKDPLLLETQLEYVMVELNGDYRSVLDRIKNSRDIPEAVHVIVYDYEAPADKPGETADRIPIAQQIHNTYAGQVTEQPGAGTPSPSAPATPSDAIDPCAPGVVAGNGVGGIDVFPQIINKRTIQSPGVGATWCYASTTNCHHDYNAADIHAPEGTVNVAAKGGTVVRVTDQVGGVGSRVTVRGSDGKYIYYYAHMAAGSLKVAKDQTIATGTPLGNVGNSTQAVNTPPHLHFDMLPASEFSYRVDCSGSACSGYPFVNVQPLLVQLYQGLPN
jgi:murein DD-endopeptidase MepM/ murein hydrolase activator NlpD